MRVTNNLLISFGVLAFVFTFSLAWAFRGDLIPPLAAALDSLRIAVGLKEAPKMVDTKRTRRLEDESNVQSGDIDKLVSELIQLEKSRRELNTKARDLKDEIGVLQSEIEDLEFVVVEAESGVGNGELQRDLDAVNEETSADEELQVEESEPADEMSESGAYTDANEQLFREYVDLYVDWLTDTRSIASENQKAYICRNSNVAQFLAVHEDAALREACSITGYSKGITRKGVKAPQTSYLCRNPNVARFLSAFKGVSMSELCGE
jgi:vacuolar-type H+-ATPase subunit I/STV1